MPWKLSLYVCMCLSVCLSVCLSLTHAAMHTFGTACNTALILIPVFRVCIVS